jgi:hypothetical protein
MTAAYVLRRTLIIGLAILAIAVVLMDSASAGTRGVPGDVVVVSSTELGSGSFTMTATNLGAAATDLDLAAPGAVSDVSVDYGSFDGRWLMPGLASGNTATMVGTLHN